MAGVPPSGPGSSVAAAANVRVALEGLSREFDLELIIDAPCGDMTWMPRVDLGRAAYVGADIVPAVVAANRAAHADRSFLPLDIADASSSAILRDIVSDRGNAALVLARHLLFHLPASDGRAVLQNVEASGARWLLTSTFVRADDAMDEYVLANGHRTNLLRPPYVRRAGSSDASRRRRGGDVDIPWE